MEGILVIVPLVVLELIKDMLIVVRLLLLCIRNIVGEVFGKIMLKTILDMARNLGYEQAELEVAAGNERAISLYKNLGFEKYGVFPNNMKYANGQYTDSYWMMKKL